MVTDDIYSFKSILNETPNLSVLHLRYVKLFSCQSDIQPRQFFKIFLGVYTHVMSSVHYEFPWWKKESGNIENEMCINTSICFLNPMMLF